MKTELFSLPPSPAPAPKPPKGQHCRNCAHCRAHSYNATVYCSLKACARTDSGMAKVKRLGWCPGWTSNQATTEVES